MSVVNPGNARIKRRYFHRLEHAEGLQRETIEAAARSIADYELFTSGKDFRGFNQKDALAYKRKLLSKRGPNGCELGSRSTALTRIRHVQRFFRWISGESGYKSHVRMPDVDYLSLSRRDLRAASCSGEKATASLEQLQHVVRSMPSATDIELRNRALFALILLTGVRVSACISLKIKHVRADGSGIFQDAREVRTKAGKTYSVFFFPVGDDILTMFQDYVRHLRTELLWGDEDALFPQTQQTIGTARKFETTGFERQPWRTPGAVWGVFPAAFDAAGVPYHTPHSIRRTLARLGQRISPDLQAMKAWSQNLGHDEVMTSLTSYGQVPEHLQRDILLSMASYCEVDGDLVGRYGPMLSDPLIRNILDRLNPAPR